MDKTDYIVYENTSDERYQHSNQVHGKTDNENNSLFTEFIFASLLIILLGWGIYYFSLPTTLPIKQVSIEGKFLHLSPASLKFLIQNQIKGNFFNIDVEQIRNSLLKEPWVYDVSVQRVWPGELRLIVKEQVALYKWNNQALMNSNGELFTPKNISEMNQLPILQGPTGTHLKVMKTYEAIKSTIPSKPIIIDALYLDKRRAWTMMINKNIRINIGRLFFDERLSRLTDILHDLDMEQLVNIDYIDMRYTNGFAVKWKNHTDRSDNRV